MTVLKNEYHRNIKRLLRFFTRPDAEGFLFAVATDQRVLPAVNREIVQLAQGKGRHITVLYLKENSQISLMEQLRPTVSNHAGGIIVANLDRFFPREDLVVNATASGSTPFQPDFISELNFGREALLRLHIPLLFWVSADHFPTLQLHAADLFTQRGMSTLFFDMDEEETNAELPVSLPQEGMIPLSPEEEETLLDKIAMLLRQLRDAKKAGQPRSRIAQNIVMPLAEAFSQLDDNQALVLLDEFRKDFNPNDTDTLARRGKVLISLYQYSEAESLLLQAAGLLGNSENTLNYLSVLVDLGDLYIDTGRIQEALDVFEKTLTLYQQLLVDKPESRYNKSQFGLVNERLGSIHTSMGNLVKALMYYNTYLQISAELYKTYPKNEAYKYRVAISFQKLGDTLTSYGNLAKALNYFEDEKKLKLELYESFPQNVSFKRGLAISYHKLGDTHTSLGNLEKALMYYENDLQLSLELYESFPQTASFKNDLAISYSKLGNIYISLGNSDKALKYYEEETKLFRELFNAFPQNVSFKNGLAISYEKLGDIFTSYGNLDKALNYFEDKTRLQLELYEAFPQNVSFKRGLAISYERLGDTNASLGNSYMALKYYEDETKLFRELFEAFPQNVSFKNGLAISYWKLGDINQTLKKKTKTRNYFQKAEKLLKELVQDSPQHTQYQQYLNRVKKDLKSLQ